MPFSCKASWNQSGIITMIGEQPLRLGQFVQQSGRANIIADLPSSHEETQRTAVCIGDSVKLGVHAALGAADQAAHIPFFTRRLDAVRWALR
ncbi:hypothetical protein SAMN02927924_04715 [Sphingobium faniae]|nr:hypothetical protein SAMN02927924_04715 [Sphingobium faniae]